MSDKTINLPSKDEMLQRLLKVDDNSHLQQKFYPKLLKEAGSQKVAMGVVMLLQLAIYDYTEGMPPAMGAVMNMRMPDFIDALCPDEEVAKEAKAFFEQAMAAK
ncbi:MAG: hypothetical protein HYV33_02825 [Candidatus Kerfeldbacteria bacterium]|nr:hypothetical protein [Candidatus Kerfeldbacteria bacterium]